MATSNHHASPTNGIGRAAYFSIGTTLFMLKFLIDWSVAHLIFDRKWSPAEYIAPGASIALLFTEPHARTFYTTMLIVALPFIAVGVWLTAMRLRSVGIPAGWTVFFFVPGINFAMFALLSVLPRRENIPLATVASTPIPPAPHTGAAPPLAYAPGVDLPETWLDRIMPTRAPEAWAVAVVVPAIIGLAATYLSVQLFHEYGWGVFVGVPFAIGLMAAMLYAPRSPGGMKGSIGAACVSVTIYGAIMLLFALEGLGCMIMAAPLAYPVAIFGAMIGSQLRARPTRLADTRRVMWVMMLFLPMFIGAEGLSRPDVPAFAVTTSVDIDAPPSRVWENVIGFGEIPAPTEWIFRTGVAYPMRAEISGRGVGAMRYCVFSTGAFEEPITAWDPPRVLKFAVTSNPPPMREWSPYANVHPPHLENFLVSNGGQFRLVELSNGRTRLEGTTWYRHHMWPAAYWRLWSDFIIHRIHLRVLNHVKSLSEATR